MTLNAGADMSQDYRFVSVVMGLQSDINSCHQSLGYTSVHMRKIAKRQEKERIARSLVIKDGMMSACFFLNRPDVILRVASRTRKPKSAATRRVDYAFRKIINDHFATFSARIGQHISEIAFETDGDLDRIFRSIGLRTAPASTAHQIADVIGWANGANIGIHNVLDRDLSADAERLALRGT